MTNKQNAVKDYIKAELKKQYGYTYLKGDSDIDLIDDVILKTGYDFEANGFKAGNTITITNTENNNGDYTIIGVIIGELNISEELTEERETSAYISNGNIFKFIGELPEDIRKIGQNYPCLLYFDDDELAEAGGSMQGMRLKYFYNFSLFLYHNIINDRISAINILDEYVIETILSDLSLNSNAVIVRYQGIEKGELSGGEPNYLSSGYYSNITVRKINFEVEINDAIN